MVNYTCERCGYETSLIGNYKKHLQRKHVCKPILNDIDIETLRAAIEQDKHKQYSCEKCAKVLSCRQSLWVHKKKCQVTSNIELLDKIQKLEEKLKKYEGNTIINNNINNNNTSQTNNTININTFNLKSFGHENMDYITKEFLNSCIIMNNIVPLIENIHFDKEHPENHNVKVKSSKHLLMETFDDGKWIITDTNDTLNELINKGYRVLNYHTRKNKSDILKTEMDEDEYENVLGWLEKIYEDKKTRRPIKKQLLILFMNNKTMLLGKEED